VSGTTQISRKPLAHDPSPFSPKQDRSVRTRSAILRAARKTISEKGVESLTIAGVAASVGLTTGAFYARFQNKDALLEALFEETLAGNQAAIRTFQIEIAASSDSLSEIIENLVVRVMTLMRDNSALFRLFGSDHRGSNAERDRAIRILEAAIEPVRDLFLERSDELPHPRPRIAAAMLIVMMQGIVDWALLLRESEEPVVPTKDKALCEEMTRAALGYLGLVST